MWFIDLQMELQNYTKRFINNQFRQKTVTLDCQQLKIDHISIGRNDINYVAMAILSINALFYYIYGPFCYKQVCDTCTGILYLFIHFNVY